MRHRRITLGLVVASTVLGLMGTDLILPAVPLLPDVLGGDAAAAQFVLAAYVAGTCVGLLAFGAASDHVPTRWLFAGSLFATAVMAAACGLAASLELLIALRFVLGAVAAGPAAFAPAVVKAMFDEAAAVRVMGALSSIESLAPALAPILGAVLLAWGGWRLPFWVLAVLAAVLGVLMLAEGGVPQVGRRARGSYLVLLSRPSFLRYAISQALVLGGLLVFVFGMPTVFVRVMGGSLSDFIIMQVTAIVTFIAAANMASRAVARFGAERVIGGGTLLAAVGAAAQLAYALAGGENALAITLLFIPANIGLGLRGPPGFYRAIVASHGDDARGSALVVLGILGAAATGTACASPWIEGGAVTVAGVSFVMHALASVTLAALPPLRNAPLTA